MLVAGEFNADLAKPEGSTRAEKITAALASTGLEDSAYFLLSRNPWLRDGCTWSMRHG